MRTGYGASLTVGRARSMSSLLLAATALTALSVRGASVAPVPPDPATLDVTALISNVCSECHGVTGVSAAALFPNLAGQVPAYIEGELKLFRQRGRNDPRARAFMWGVARGLTDEQIKGVARQFSSEAPARGTASRDTALAARGKVLYDNGAVQRDIEACTVCHGHDGEGVNANPRVAGQHQDYLLTAMLQFRSRLRENRLMQDVARNLTDAEIAALVAYVSSK